MTASPEERARRRFEELKAAGKNVTYEEVYNDMILRDSNDATREIAPAVPAEDAVILDNTGFTVDDSVNAVIEIIRSKENGEK